MESEPRKRVKTQTDENGGTSPEWNRKLASLNYKRVDKSDIVCFELWYENSVSDVIIGQASCRLSQLWNRTESLISLPVTHNGKRSGSATIRVSAHFTDNQTVALGCKHSFVCH